MTVWDFLLSPAGQELSHLVVAIAIAITGWGTFRTHHQAKQNAEKLNGHLDQHNARQHN